MSKKIIPFFIGIIFFSGYHLAFAGLSINEIMYNVTGVDTDHEWIEVLNTSATDTVDLSGWKFNDGSNHSLNAPPSNGGQGSLLIPPGTYAIFSGNASTFFSDHPGFSGTVIDTVMSLSNTGATLELIKSDNSVVDTVTYNSSQGANEDGNSLQKISGSWVGAVPTPGAANTVSASASNSSGTGGLVNNNINIDNSSAQTANTTATAPSKNKITEEPKIKTQISGSELAFEGIPVKFASKTSGYSGEKLLSGKYFWNFGDGDSKEVNMSDSQIFTHTYFYEGDYVVSLEYYLNPYSDVPDASDTMTIKVVPANILISAVGDEKDFFIELSNNTDYDVNLSNWVLSNAVKSFTIPRNTIIGSKKKIIISSKITNFSILDKNTLKLMTPGRGVVFDYASSVIPVVPIVPSGIATEPKASDTVVTAVKPPEVHSKSENKLTSAADMEISAENLPVPAETVSTIAGAGLGGPASVIESNGVKDDSNDTFTIIISLIFIGAGAGAVYFIRQKKTVRNAGDDFNILDE